MMPLLLSGHRLLRLVASLLALFLFPISRSHAVVDLNGNGMGDIWELVYGASNLTANADTDGDGESNLRESIAGTNPQNPASIIAITKLTLAGDNINISWPSLAGKRYQVQSCTNLASGVWLNEGGLLAGTGGELTAIVPALGNRQWLHVIVQDVDTDGDGVPDWDELQIGYDPNKTATFGGTNDFAAITAALTAPNTVSIQALNAVGAMAGPVPATLQVKRAGNLNAITIPYAASGTATAGVDYIALPGTITLPVGVNTATNTVTPKTNLTALAAKFLTLTIQSNAAYTVGSPGAASVVIDPMTTPTGTGLTGQFYDNASSTYTNAANFTGLLVTRVDTNINFDWGQGAPDPSMGTNTFSIRWTGQVQSKNSETITFVTTSDDGVKLWVNNQLIIDHWTNQSATSWTGALDLKAGVRYDLKLEYFENTSTASIQLLWRSPSLVQEVIPMAYLYPNTNAPAGITGPASAVGLVGGPFSMQIQGVNSPTNYSALHLPSGLSLNVITGLITGTPTTAGNYKVILGAANGRGSGFAVLDLTIINSGGTVNEEYWLGVTGSSITNIPVTSPASGTNVVALLQAPSNWADNFGARLRGYITPQVSGNYRFWISSAGASEFRLSNNHEPAALFKRAWVTNSTAPLQWNAEPHQVTPLLRLKAGQAYYFEALQIAGLGSDHLAIGWSRPTDSTNSPAEIVPGYTLSSYAAPAPLAGNSTLYATTMTPQPGAMTLGTGAATLRVAADELSADLAFYYSNLTGPKSGEHIHDASHGGAIIFDIDTAAPTNGVYHWVFAPTGNITVQDVVNAIKTGTAYINIHTATYPSGEIKGFFQLAAGSQTFTPPAAPPALPGGTPTTNDAVRFLTQATFGPTTSQIARVQSIGFDAWLTEQFAMSPSSHLQLVNNYYAAFPLASTNNIPQQNAWWQHAVTAPDQLRQRIAFALSEIFVVSTVDGDLNQEPWGMSRYYDLLCTNAFGNFRQLLEDVTLSPIMGDYLDMRRNDKPDPVTGRSPNENYAREVLQLFSIGLNLKHPDGSLKLDSQGLPVASYDQDTVVGFAHTFTGWNYFSTNQSWFAARDYTQPMLLVTNHHDTGEKLLLNNVALPANQAGTLDMQQALDLIFNHPNTGIFVSRQLIQRLVTGNPSPGYTYRVARVFDDNGAGVRGDLQAVVRAVLLDYEARTTNVVANYGFGHQREPVVRTANVLRAFNAFSNTNFWNMGYTDAGLTQTPLNAPTVFNFFEPDYIAPGEIALAGLYSPEFQITSETTTINAHNFLWNGIRRSDGISGTTSNGFQGDVEIMVEYEKTLAPTPSLLVNHLNSLLMAGSMSTNMQNIIVNYLNTLPTGNDANNRDRARRAIQLIVTSPDFAIEK